MYRSLSLGVAVALLIAASAAGRSPPADDPPKPLTEEQAIDLLKSGKAFDCFRDMIHKLGTMDKTPEWKKQFNGGAYKFREGKYDEARRQIRQSYKTYTATPQPVPMPQPPNPSAGAPTKPGDNIKPADTKPITPKDPDAEFLAEVRKWLGRSLRAVEEFTARQLKWEGFTARQVAAFLLLADLKSDKSDDPDPKKPKRVDMAFVCNAMLRLEPDACSIGDFYGGLGRARNVLDAYRLDGAARPLVIGAGTSFIPDEFDPKEADQLLPAAKVMATGLQKLGAAAYAPTCGDLRLGLDNIRAVREVATFPFVSANLVDTKTGRLLYPASVDVRAGDTPVRVIGLAAPSALPQGVTALPVVKALRDALDSLKGAQPAFVVVVTDHDDPGVLVGACPEVRLVVTAGANRDGWFPRGPESLAIGGGHLHGDRGVDSTVRLLSLQSRGDGTSFHNPDYVKRAAVANIRSCTEQIRKAEAELAGATAEDRAYLLAKQNGLREWIRKEERIMAVEPARAIGWREVSVSITGSAYDRPANEVTRLVDDHFRATAKRVGRMGRDPLPEGRERKKPYEDPLVHLALGNWERAADAADLELYLSYQLQDARRPARGELGRRCDLYLMRAVAFGRLGEWKLAAENYAEAFTLNPVNPNRELLAKFLIDWQDVAERALPWADHDDPQAMLACGVVCAELGRWDEAAAWYERAYAWERDAPEQERMFPLDHNYITLRLLLCEANVRRGRGADALGECAELAYGGLTKKWLGPDYELFDFGAQWLAVCQNLKAAAGRPDGEQLPTAPFPRRRPN